MSAFDSVELQRTAQLGPTTVLLYGLLCLALPRLSCTAADGSTGVPICRTRPDRFIHSLRIQDAQSIVHVAVLGTAVPGADSVNSVMTLTKPHRAYVADACSTTFLGIAMSYIGEQSILLCWCNSFKRRRSDKHAYIYVTKA